MSNTADSSPNISATLEEESDVIELTEEVKGDAAPTPDEATDDLAFAMPEFRVPSGQSSVVDSDGEGSKQKSVISTSSVVDEEDSLEEEFDREELVRTARMEAFDRSQIELLDSVRKWEVSSVLLDQRYSPDILVAPPRVLTKKWKEGPPESSKDGALQRDSPSDDRSSLATTVKSKTISDDDVARAEVEPSSEVGLPDPPKPSEEESEAEIITDPSEIGEEIEIDSFEDVRKPPPPKPGIAPKRPPQARQTPGRKRTQTRPIPKRQPQPTPVPGVSSADDDMSGIVQELLEEKKPKTRQQTPAEVKRNNWFLELFNDEYLRTLSKDLKDHTDHEIEFIIRSLGVKKSARIFDLACGFGRHSIELAEREFEVAGLDLSRPLLQRALTEAQRRSLAIKFIHGDMRELNFKEIFDACFCWQSSFGYFDDKTNFQVLKGVHRALKSGGRFLLDLVNRDYVVAEMPSRTWWEGVECVFLEEVEFDYDKSILQTKRSFIYEDGSPPQEYTSYLRLYGLHELRQLLNIAGFDVLEVSGELHHRGAFLGPNSSKLIVLAEKR